jgi:hypothetical protein
MYVRRHLGSLFLLISLATLIQPVQNSTFAVTDEYGREIPDGKIPFYFRAQDPFFARFNFSSPPGNSSGQYVTQHVYPVCRDGKDFDCIVSVDYVDDKGVNHPGNFEEYLPVGFRGSWYGYQGNACCKYEEAPFYYSTERILLKGDTKRKIPDGSRTSIWTFPGLKHQDGNKFLVSMMTTSQMTNHSAPNAADSVVDWTSGTTSLGITPVKIDNDISGLQITSETYEKKTATDIKITRTSVLDTYGQAGNDKKICYAGKTPETPNCFSKTSIETKPRFKLTARLKLAQEFLGLRHWFIGRASDIDVSSRRNGDSLLVSFSGTSIEVPEVTTLIPRTLEGYKLYLSAINKSYEDSGVRNQPVDVNDESGFLSWFQTLGSGGTDGTDPGAIGFWSGIESGSTFLTPKSKLNWSFMSANVSSTDTGWLWPCVKSPQISGVSASNAAVIRPTPPKWNPLTETLEYRIASTKLDDNGEENRGFYDLIVSQEVASCLWGSGILKARAEVAITNDRGETKVFTSSYKVEDGYLKFRVSGFTYSVNTVKIKLVGGEEPSQQSQKNASSDKNLSTSQPSAVVGNTRAKPLTCVKGKTVKKVSAKTCPTGYKKR